MYEFLYVLCLAAYVGTGLLVLRVFPFLYFIELGAFANYIPFSGCLLSVCGNEIRFCLLARMLSPCAPIMSSETFCRLLGMSVYAAVSPVRGLVTSFPALGFSFASPWVGHVVASVLGALLFGVSQVSGTDAICQQRASPS
jgi:hypothetical protein